jgi:outer membrane receptor protein involved in Fe transport
MPKTRTVLRFLGVTLVLATLMAPKSLLAQSATGSIAGIVGDPSGGGLPGASVTARNVATGATRSAVSGSTGSFAFPLLPPGKYDVSAALSGFEPAKVSDVVVNIGGDVSLKLTLTLGRTEAVTVTMEAPLVETTKSQVSAVVNETSIATLPTNGRNFIDFVLTTPGVVRDVRLGDISFAGQRGTLNSLVVDGADNNNSFFGQALGRTGSGRAPYQFSQDAVQEFQVNSNAYSAEYGRAGGAVINVVTKSGTNDFHGGAFFFLRAKSLTANDYINVINNRAKGPYDFKQFGASFGGPVAKDRFFFFANYDGQRNTSPNTVVLNLPATIPNDPDTQAGLAKLQALANSWERRQDQNVYLLKLDGEIGNTTHVSLRYNHQDFTGKNFENGGLQNSEQHTGNSLVKTDTVSGNVTTSFGASVLNELRGQWAKDREPGEANSNVPEATVRQGGQTVLTIGRNFFSPRETTVKRWQVADTATLLLSSHTVKAGFDLNVDKILNYFPGNFSGAYTFQSLASYNLGVPSGSGERYVQAFAGAGTSGPTTNPDVTDLAFFVQDEWRPFANLTVNAGLRYDRQSIAQPSVQNPDAQLLAAGIDTSVVNVDENNFGARLGLAFTPTADGRTVIRAGYGMFYGRTPAIMIGTAHSNNGINVQTITFTGAQVPTYPNVLPGIPAGASVPKPTIFYFDKDYDSPFVQQASAGVERGVTDDLAVGLSYLYVKGKDLPRTIDENVGAATDVTYEVQGDGTVTVHQYSSTRPFSNFTRVISFQSTADSTYHGLSLDVTKRYSHHWQGRIAYTWGKVLDTKPDATAVVPQSSDDAKFAQDPRNLQGDYGPGDNDVRHRLVVSGLWNLDYFGNASPVTKWVLGGWSISGILSIATGQPYSATVGSDLNNDGNNRNDRAPGVGRNTYRLPTQISLDPRITKEIPIGPVRLQLIAEAFNVLNRSNVSSVNTTYYSLVSGKLVPQASFGTPLASSGARIVQLAAKLIF